MIRRIIGIGIYILIFIFLFVFSILYIGLKDALIAWGITFLFVVVAAIAAYDFAVLKAQIKYRKGDDMSLTTRHYFIEREEVIDDIKLLQEKEIEFWVMVQKRIEPPLLLPSI